MSHSDAPANRWWILAALMSVSIMTPIDMSAVNIVIARLQDYFHVPSDQVGLVAWVTLAYLLVIVGLMLPLGRLGDLFGFRRLFLSGVVLFTLSSALCGLAPTLGWLVAARAVQGIGACMMMALSSGIVTAIFPARERGRAMGVVGMCVALGLVAGPILGGLLTMLLSWHWIFYINLPIGLIGGLCCWRMLPAIHTAGRQRIDWQGALIVIITLMALMLAITQGQEWGWRSPRILGLLVVGLLGLVAFLLVERRHPAPMLDLTLFRNRVFAGGSLAAMMNYLGQFCAIFLTPLLLQKIFGFSTGRTGLVMSAIPLTVLVVAPISGYLSDRVGTRLLAAAGETLVTIGLLGLALALPQRQVGWLIPPLMLVGLGTGLFQSPNTSAIMGSVPRTHLGVGGGVIAVVRNLGMALGIALASALATLGLHHLPPHAAAHLEAQALQHGISLGYLTGAAFALLGALASAARQDLPHASPSSTLEVEPQRR